MTSGRVCDFGKFREISFLELFLDFYYLGSNLELFFENSRNFIFGLFLAFYYLGSNLELFFENSRNFIFTLPARTDSSPRRKLVRVGKCLVRTP